MARFMEIGEKVALARGAVAANGEGDPLPAGTVGRIVGFARGLPQVNFGDGRLVIVPPHYLEPLNEVEGVPVELYDGETIYSWDLYVALQRRAREGAQG